MKVGAPGKLLLTGAYAVLEGAPAIVVAIDRLAVADGAAHDPDPPREVRAAFPEGGAPRIDVRALHAGEKKLGLGSSAAALVAALGVRAAARGEDLRSADVRANLLREARAAHAAAQSGGSGVDVAASVHGGVLRYQLDGGEARVRKVSLPRGLHVTELWSGTSARTSDLRAAVDDLRRRSLQRHTAIFQALREHAQAASEAVDAGDAAALVAAADAGGLALATLGREADAPIVPDAWSALAEEARADGAAFLPSGAGGGDVAVFLGTRPPSDAWMVRARARGFVPLELSTDPEGVRALD